jgi:hypothetical protein
MAANITAVIDPNQLGPNPDGEGRIKERVKLTGTATAANDTGTYTPKFFKRPLFVESPGFAHSINASTGEITFTALHALGSNSQWVTVVGYA